MEQILEKVLTKYLIKINKFLFFQSWDEDCVERLVIGNQDTFSPLDTQQVGMPDAHHVPDRFDIGDRILLQLFQ